MGQNSKKQLQLQRMFKRQRGRCNWCGLAMIPPGTHKGKGKPPPLLCTYDHLDCRFSDDRGKHAGEYRNVAACWTCNNNRAMMQQANVSKKILWEKSGAYPLEMRTPASDAPETGAKRTPLRGRESAIDNSLSADPQGATNLADLGHGAAVHIQQRAEK